MIIYIYSQYFGFGVDHGQTSTDHFDPSAEVPVRLDPSKTVIECALHEYAIKKGGPELGMRWKLKLQFSDRGMITIYNVNK